eukprot:1007879-Rhodomonas_salina.1
MITCRPVSGSRFAASFVARYRLRFSYAMSGTDLRFSYAMSGTDLAYAATRRRSACSPEGSFSPLSVLAPTPFLVGS